VKFSLDKASAKVVKVDKAGKVTALAKGTAKITVKAGGLWSEQAAGTIVCPLGISEDRYPAPKLPKPKITKL